MTNPSTLDNEKINTLQTHSTETTKIDMLNPRDLMRHLQETTKNTNLFALMQETITLDHDISRGLEEVELKEFIHDTEEPSVRNMLERLLDLHENEDMLLATTEERENHTCYSYMVKGERMKNGKFDVLVIRATQAKQVDKKKLIAMGIASVAAGLIIGSTLNPAL